MFLEIPLNVKYVLATFIRKFATKNFLSSSNLAALSWIFKNAPKFNVRFETIDAFWNNKFSTSKCHCLHQP